jgi:hypothetical protein
MSHLIVNNDDNDEKADDPGEEYVVAAKRDFMRQTQ